MKILVAFLALCAMSLSALAQPPGWDFYGGLNRDVLYCQSKDDLKTLIDTQRKNIEAGEKLYSSYSQEKMSNGYLRCSSGNIGYAQFGDNEDLGVIKDPDGEYVHAWLVNVGNRNLGFWIFYTEDAPDRDI